MQRNIIYHYPAPLPKGRSIGSGVHPAGMLSGFHQAGYHVGLVAGHAHERIRASNTDTSLYGDRKAAERSVNVLSRYN